MALVDTLGFWTTDIQREVEAGYVSAQKHPTLPLTIYNYTTKTQIENHWNAVTKWCRGLILDSHAQIVAQPMPKFFNYGDAELGITAAQVSSLNRNHGKPLILEKLDGSLGILWRYQNRSTLDVDYGIATRGSFVSKQAIWATEWLHRHIAGLRARGRAFEFYGGWTLLFEIIYPENRIVCKYDWAGLILLAAMRNGYQGGEMGYSDMLRSGEYNFLRVAQRSKKTLDECVAEDVVNKEGYVVKWHRGSSAPAYRCKIKHPNYVRLHKIVTTSNPKEIWQMVVDGADFSQLLGNDMPGHFKEYVNSWRKKISQGYKEIDEKVNKVLLECQLPMIPNDKEARKALAAYFNQYPDISSLLFAKLDGMDTGYRRMVYEMIKPKGNDILQTEEAA
jgi:RNA ligase